MTAYDDEPAAERNRYNDDSGRHRCPGAFETLAETKARLAEDTAENRARNATVDAAMEQISRAFPQIETDDQREARRLRNLALWEQQS